MKWYPLIELLPPVYRSILAMSEIASIENDTLLSALSLFYIIRSNFFIQTCDETTLSSWEALLQIVVDPTDSMSYRRRRVLTYLNNLIPFTHTYWIEVLNQLIGEEEWSLRVEDNQIILLITDQTPTLMIQQLTQWAARVKPAHVGFYAGWHYDLYLDNYLAFNGMVGVTENAICELPPIRGDWGIMTDNGDTTYESPRGTIKMALMLLLYGGGENLVIPFDNAFVYGGGVSQYMVENIEKKGYLRSSAYQNANKSVSANSENYLYPEGGDSTIDGDSQLTYLLTGAYTAANVSVSITGASLIVSASKLKLVWGTTSASVCYITYKEY